MTPENWYVPREKPQRKPDAVRKPTCEKNTERQR
jgi:hypothetical protein